MKTFKLLWMVSKLLILCPFACLCPSQNFNQAFEKWKKNLLYCYFSTLYCMRPFGTYYDICFLVCKKYMALIVHWHNNVGNYWTSHWKGKKHDTTKGGVTGRHIWYYIGWWDLVFLYWFWMPRMTGRSYMYLLLCCTVSDLWQKINC